MSMVHPFSRPSSATQRPLITRTRRRSDLRRARTPLRWEGILRFRHLIDCSFECPRRADQRSDLLRISRRHRIVDDHAEIRPTIDRERRIFEGDRAEYRMPYVLDALAMASNIVVAPHYLELGAEPAELIDKGFHLRRRPRPCCVHPKRAHHEPRHACPIVLGSADARIKEDEAQYIALLRWQRSVIGQHHKRRPVPLDHVPSCGPDGSAAPLHLIQSSLQPN